MTVYDLKEFLEDIPDTYDVSIITDYGDCVPLEVAIINVNPDGREITLGMENL